MRSVTQPSFSQAHQLCCLAGGMSADAPALSTSKQAAGPPQPGSGPPGHFLQLSSTQGTLLPHQAKALNLTLTPQRQGRFTSSLSCFVSADRSVLEATASSVLEATPGQLSAARDLLAAELRPSSRNSDPGTQNSFCVAGAVSSRC